MQIMLMSGIVSVALMLGACRPNGSPKLSAPEVQSSHRAQSAPLVLGFRDVTRCNGADGMAPTAIVLGDRESGPTLAGGALVPYAFTYQACVTGQANGSKWHAIGASVTTSHVFLRSHANGLADPSKIPAQLYVRNGASLVTIDGDGHEALVGSLTKLARAYPVAIDRSLRVDLVYNGEPYDVKRHDPQAADAQPEIWLTP